MNADNVRTVFEEHGADDVRSGLEHVSGWVEADAAEDLVETVPEAEIIYYTDDGREAFVSTV